MEAEEAERAGTAWPANPANPALPPPIEVPPAPLYRNAAAPAAAFAALRNFRRHSHFVATAWLDYQSFRELPEAGPFVTWCW